MMSLGLEAEPGGVGPIDELVPALRVAVGDEDRGVVRDELQLPLPPPDRLLGIPAARTRPGRPGRRRRCCRPASRIGAALSSMGLSVPSRAISTVWLARPTIRPSASARRAGFSTGWRVSSLTMLEDRLQRQPLRLVGPPAGQRLGDRVERDDPSVRVGGDQPVADALQGGPEQLPLLVDEGGVVLGPPPGGPPCPSEQGDPDADHQVEDQPGLVLEPLDGQAVTGRQEEPGRGGGTQADRQQGGATAGVAGHDEDGQEERGEGEQVAQDGVERQAGDRRQEDGEGRSAIAQRRRAGEVGHGRAVSVDTRGPAA